MTSTLPTSKEFVTSSDSESDSDGAKPKAKKAKKEIKTEREKKESTSNKTVVNGVEMIDLGRKRFASVSEFKGKKYVNIREYYTDTKDGKMKPGKKGIAMNATEWSNLKACMGELDSEML